ncbi:hypothetical protein N431DRAFT_419496 [Stipitochalara longipes BDJ]|nr:hypothetical protein N431DRAFT_419496 [Stipitochalara longipes BDJ]
MATGLAPGSGLPDVNKGPQILGAVATTTILALIVVAMRLYVRIWMLRSASFDDYFIVAGMACSLISFGINIPDVMYGAGRHAAYISPPSKITTGLKLNFVTQPVLLSGVTFVKVSIGFFLLRIAPDNRYRRSIIGAITFLLVITTFFIITLFVQCSPLAAVWDFSLRPTASCWNPSVLRKMSYANSSLNLVTDLGFALVPWPILWNIQLAKRIKVALLAVLSLGVFSCIAGIMKITILHSYGRSGDFLYDSAELTIWTTTELNVGILAGSIPCLKPLYRILLEKSGCLPKDSPNDILSFSYVMESLDVRSNDVYRSQIEGDESEVNMQMFGETGLMKPTRVSINDVSKENPLRVHAPGILKATETEVHSVEEGNRAVANKVSESTEEGQTGES